MPGTAREGPISRRRFFWPPDLGDGHSLDVLMTRNKEPLSEKCDEEPEAQRLVAVLGGLAAEFGNRVLLKGVADVAAE